MEKRIKIIIIRDIFLVFWPIKFNELKNLHENHNAEIQNEQGARNALRRQ